MQVAKKYDNAKFGYHTPPATEHHIFTLDMQLHIEHIVILLS